MAGLPDLCDSRTADVCTVSRSKHFDAASSSCHVDPPFGGAPQCQVCMRCPRLTSAAPLPAMRLVGDASRAQPHTLQCVRWATLCERRHHPDHHPNHHA